MSDSANAAKSFFRQTQSTPRKLEAWQTWILICAVGAGVTFCFNLALTIWASTFGLENGTATIKVGKCSDIKTWDLWLHLGINVLSSTLLAASNYTMQCLSAPVREEIDKGHRERIALDIGIPSLKNLRRISRIKLILWGLLAVSSIPLHLVYNSVVFSTLSAHSYPVLVVTSDFLSGAPFANPTDSGAAVGMDNFAAIENIRRNISVSKQNQSNSEWWQELDSKQCREAYRPSITSDRSDVLAVSFANATGNSLLYYMEWPMRLGSGSWTCSNPNGSLDWEAKCRNSTTDYFEIYGYPIDHCLSRRTAETCQLQFSLPIMTIVMICNLAKAVCMLLTIRHRFATPILTLGDAVASFLKRPDIYTKNNCLSDKYRFQQRSKVEKSVDQLDLQPLHPPLCKPSLWRFFQQSGAKKSYISTDDSLNGEELQDLVAGNLPLKNHDILEHQDWKERIRSFLSSVTFNGQTVQGLVAGEPSLKNGFTSQLDNNAREYIRGFLSSVTFNGQSVQGLVTGKLPLKKGSTSQHDNNALEHEGWSQNIKEWSPKRHFWFSAARTFHWLFSLSLLSTAIIGVCVLLGYFYANGKVKNKSMRNLWEIGYGATLPELLIRYGENGSFAPMILLANLPQTILSFLYLTYNALFTCMLIAKEWNQFAHKRKTLRVSDPVEEQRSTYWLQLPYTYSIPLLIMSSLLHWLISQALFLVRIEEVETKTVLTSCGYSPIAIITVIAIGVILVLVIVLTGFRRYEKGIPLAGSSSAAISAACHPPGDDVDARFLPVMWGDVKTDDSTVGHCCFTSFAVSTPVEGNMYACVDDIGMQKGLKN